MICLNEKQKIILKHYHEGKTQRAISRETGISRKTIRSYIKRYEEKRAALAENNDPEANNELISSIVEKPKYDSSSREKLKLNKEVIDEIKHHLEENEKKRAIGRHKQQKKKIDIYEALQKKGYDIGYTTVCNTVRHLDKETKEAYIKQEYGPGEVCEFDWTEVKLTIAGQKMSLQMAAFTDASGNYRDADLFRNQKTESFLEAHADFFENIQGVYHQMVYDNTRVVVKRFVGPTEKEPTEELIKLSMYYGFKFRFCNNNAGWEKPHVERSIEYIRRKAFSRRDEFSSIEEAQEHLKEVLQELNSKKQPHNNNKSAREILEKEREHLLPVPPRYDTARTTEARVDKFSTICVDSCHYSVPELYVGDFVLAKVYTSKIVCYHNSEKIAEHKRKYGFKKWSIDIKHYQKTLKKKPGALAGSVALKQVEPELQKIYHQYYTGREKEFIYLIELIGEKSWEEVKAAISSLEKLPSVDISTDKVKAICNRKEDHLVKNDEITEARSREMLSIYDTFLSPQNKTSEGVEIL